MAITVPSSTPIALAANEISGEYYQVFMTADTNGLVYDESNPFPNIVVVTGYASTAANYQGTYLPTGGVYIADLTGTDFVEMVDGETATARMNNRRAIMTASDGQVTTLTEGQVNNYHDTVVASGSVFNGVTVPAYSSFFAYIAQQVTRYIYVPLSKSGWSRLNLFVKHDLVNNNDSQPAYVGVNIFADFGQFTNDFPIVNDAISGAVGVMAGRAYMCKLPTISGSNSMYISEFDSPLAGVIIAITNSTPVTGNIEIYASKGS
jgi:hypothetical protein